MAVITLHQFWQFKTMFVQTKYGFCRLCLCKLRFMGTGWRTLGVLSVCADWPGSHCGAQHNGRSVWCRKHPSLLHLSLPAFFASSSPLTHTLTLWISCLSLVASLFLPSFTFFSSSSSTTSRLSLPPFLYPSPSVCQPVHRSCTQLALLTLQN